MQKKTTTFVPCSVQIKNNSGISIHLVLKKDVLSAIVLSSYDVIFKSYSLRKVL